MEPTDTTQGRQPSALVSFLLLCPHPLPARAFKYSFPPFPLLSTRLGHRQPFSFLSRLARGENARARGPSETARRGIEDEEGCPCLPGRRGRLERCGLAGAPLSFFFGLSFSPASPFFPFISTCSSGWFLRFPCLHHHARSGLIRTKDHQMPIPLITNVRVFLSSQ
jgi:hypothetical protein